MPLPNRESTTAAPTTVDEALKRRIRAAFVAKGTSLSGWCRQHDVDPSWAQHVLSGRRTGPAAEAIRREILEAAGLELDK